MGECRLHRLLLKILLAKISRGKAKGEKVTPEETLMARVRDGCGGFIAEAVKGTRYPASLLAALTANESGGDATKTRFEPAIFAKFAKIIVAMEAGHEASYGAIGAQDLVKWCAPAGRSFAESVLSMINLATSWGPTQIMGYEALAGGFLLSELTSLDTHFKHTVAMLDQFRKRWNLTLPAFTPYFRCWNTGRPDGQTADPQYVANGLARMATYERLATL